jgi:ubiquinone/menaquinone biosynthesis C-methylase UbiE
MVEKARANAEKGGYANVEFRPGEIEHLPVETGTIDVVISNCVINLVPDKGQAFRETLRVLKPGGRLMISDLVLDGELPASLRASLEAYVGCIAGASRKGEYLRLMEEAGFTEVEILEESTYPVEFAASDPLVKNVVEETGLSTAQLVRAAKVVTSVKVSARKPEAA